MEKLTQWFKKQWLKFKKLIVGILVALGLIVPALAGVKDFTYTPANLYTDGTPMPIDHIAETRLYCDGDLVTPKAVEAGADGLFAGVVFTPGDHSCSATHVATNGIESDQSGVVNFTVLPEVAPNPPVNLAIGQ